MESPGATAEDGDTVSELHLRPSGPSGPRMKKPSVFRRKIDSVVSNINDLVHKSFTSEVRDSESLVETPDDAFLESSLDPYARSCLTHAHNYLTKGDDLAKAEELHALGHSAWLGGHACMDEVGKCYVGMLTKVVTGSAPLLKVAAIRALCELVVLHEENQERGRVAGLLRICADNIVDSDVAVGQWSCHLLFALCCNNTENQKYLMECKKNIKMSLATLKTTDWSTRNLNDAQQLLIMLDPKISATYTNGAVSKTAKRE